MSFKITHTPTENPATLAITIDQVSKIYIGKGNNCRCGCAGEYHEPETDSKLIERYLAKMASGKYPVTSIDGYIFEIELSRRSRVNDYGKVTSLHIKVATLYLKQTDKA